MTSTRQEQLGPYELLAPIGAGGMGEVFRARDVRLKRDVAIKLLPQEFARDAGRLQRFEQESKALAALNHPNILTIHDAGVHEGKPYLVSELLEGKTLREEMNGEPLAVRKASEYALQIARGLAAAHHKGIIHRDLKPENIFTTNDGRVKVLDFGLAKTTTDFKECGPSAVASVEPNAVTRVESTQPGALLGTPGYMSPEQVRGEPADHRSDIFAFGCVLYEMVTGTRAFRRETPVASMNAVLSEAPPELAGMNVNIPVSLERIVNRCLEKTPERRFQSADDLAFAIENANASSADMAALRRPRESVSLLRSPLIPWTAVGLCLAAVVWAFLWTHPPAAAHLQSRPIRRLPLTLTTPGTVLAPTARVWPVISPDGRKIAYGTSDGLWLHWLDQPSPPIKLAGGEDVLAPFWSPQSTDVAYFDGKSLMRVSISEKRPIAITTLQDRVDRDRAGAAWLEGERILFTTGKPALYLVPAQGGNVTVALAGRTGDTSFASAIALPNSRGALFELTRSGEHTRAIAAWSLSGPPKVVLGLGKTSIRGLACSPTGAVLFGRWDATRGIWGFPFSLEKLQATGDLRRISDNGYLPSIAEDGTLVCGVGGEQDSAAALRRMVWVDRSGKVSAAIQRAMPCMTGIRLSPDERQVVMMAGETIDALDIWLVGLGTGQPIALTQTPFQESLPGWWDEGRTVLFSRTSTDSPQQVLSKPAQAVGREEIVVPDFFAWTFFSPKKLLIGRRQGRWGYLSLAGGAPSFVPFPEPLQQMGQPEVSPDGRLLAYRAPESGPGEVYVADFPEFTNIRQVSRGGGFDPQWRPGSAELFFLSEDGQALMSARQKKGSAEFGAPAKVLDLAPSIDPGRPGWPPFYSVAQDGERFLMLQNSDENASPVGQTAKANALLIENWSQALPSPK